MKHRVSTTFLCLALGLASPAAAQDVKIAILPVVVNALDGHQYLQQGLADMLASRIGRYDGVAIVRLDDPEAATSNPAKAREAGREAGAEYVVFGSFTTFGNGASLDLGCGPTAEDERSRGKEVFVQAGTLSEIIPKLDGLAQRVARFAVTGRSLAPPVASAPPGAGARAGGDGVDPAAFQALRERVEALEREVYAAGEAVEEEDLRPDADPAGGE